MAENIKTYSLLLSGRVQGVGFRYFTESIAGKYNIMGYVKNTPAGNVELLCQGEEEEVRIFIDEIGKGPAFSVITDVVTREVTDNKIYNCFEIKY
ncbi:MAG: acylphosphatase [Actinobacteria bacterium]|nr:acylphosphatase [Actinomycetota bacterium]